MQYNYGSRTPDELRMQLPTFARNFFLNNKVIRLQIVAIKNHNIVFSESVSVSLNLRLSSVCLEIRLFCTAAFSLSSKL